MRSPRFECRTKTNKETSQLSIVLRNITRGFIPCSQSPWIFLDKSGKIQGDSASPEKKERIIDAEIEVLYIEKKSRYTEAITTVKVSN